MAASGYGERTAAETLRLIAEGVDPWLAIGQFLDDWRRAPAVARPVLVASPPAPADG